MDLVGQWQYLPTHFLNNLVTNYDVDLSEGITSLVIETYYANLSNFYQKNYDANSLNLLLRTKIYRINKIEEIGRAHVWTPVTV